MAKNALVKQQFTKEQLDLITSTVAEGATENELNLFLYVCKKTNLDPFTRQIYSIARKTWNKDKKAYDVKRTIQISIDGSRAIAARTGELAGIEDAQFDVEDAKHPNKATVTVYRLIGGAARPFTASARWDEYVQTTDEYVNGSKTGNKIPSAMWAKMPYLMLGKVAESLALRKAFPNDLSGIYTNEEMPDVEVEPEIKMTPESQNTSPVQIEEQKETISVEVMITDEQKEEINFLLKKLRIDEKKSLDWINKSLKSNITSVSALSSHEAETIIKALQIKLAKLEAAETVNVVDPSINLPVKNKPVSASYMQRAMNCQSKEDGEALIGEMKLDKEVTETKIKAIQNVLKTKNF